MGANLANEVADEKFCETTIGCKDPKVAPLLRDIMQADYFRVVVVDDRDAVEVCGALKVKLKPLVNLIKFYIHDSKNRHVHFNQQNIVACGAGFVDGLALGDNTKAAVIRLGLMEMIKFVDVFYPGSKLSTFFESCGVADLITTCYGNIVFQKNWMKKWMNYAKQYHSFCHRLIVGGRNRKVSEAYVKTGKSIKELETEMLNGQKLQGPITAEEVNFMLKNKGMEAKWVVDGRDQYWMKSFIWIPSEMYNSVLTTHRFPLFTAIHKICTDQLKPNQLIDCIRQHPEHM